MKVIEKGKYTWVLMLGGIIFLLGHSCNSGTDLTFNQDISPIIFEHCTPCHRSGGAAPFALSNYKEVKRKRSTIVKVTQSGYMPPWPANINYTHFIGEKTSH